MNQNPIFQHLQWAADAFAHCEHAIPLPLRDAVRNEFRQRINAILEEVNNHQRVASDVSPAITK